LDRVPYRRVTPTREVRGREQIRPAARSQHRQVQSNAKISPSETFMVQMVLSILILAAVIVICLVDIAPLPAARNGLRQVLAGAETVDEFTASVRRFGENRLNIEPTYIESEQYTQPFVYPAHQLTVIEEPPTRPVPGLWD